MRRSVMQVYQWLIHSIKLVPAPSIQTISSSHHCHATQRELKIVLYSALELLELVKPAVKD